MNNLIRSELLKQRTVRLPPIAIAAAAITGALTAIAIITTSGHAGNPLGGSDLVPRLGDNPDANLQ